MPHNNQNSTQSTISNSYSLGDDFALKEDSLGVDTTTSNSDDSRPPQHGNKGSDRDVSEILNKAIEGKQRAIAAGNKLKQDWMDAEYWRALAKERQYRLPHWYLPLTATGMEAVLHDLSVDRDFFREHFGPDLKSYQAFVDLNPNAPLWAFAGWVLEQLEY